MNHSLTLTIFNRASRGPVPFRLTPALTPIKSHAIPNHPVQSCVRVSVAKAPFPNGARGIWAGRGGWPCEFVPWIVLFRTSPTGSMQRAGCRYRPLFGVCWRGTDSRVCTFILRWRRRRSTAAAMGCCGRSTGCWRRSLPNRRSGMRSRRRCSAPAKC